MKKLKRWIDCHIKDEHVYDIGYDAEMWRSECERQLDIVGYIECRCMYCGKKLMRIVPGKQR